MSTKPALGRGLGSLIPQKTPPPTPAPSASLPAQEPEHADVREGRILQIPIERIRVNPRQPRRYFDDETLADLQASIAVHGLLQPLVVSQVPDGSYVIIAGERRLRSCKALGFDRVPAIVRDTTDQQKLELALIENIQREDLNPVEEALAYRMLTEEFGLRQEAVAERVGKSRGAIANLIRILELPERMLEAVQDGRLTKSHARTLLAEPDSQKREELFEAMLSGLSVRAAEQKTSTAGSRPHYGSRFRDPNLLSLERRLRDKLATKVKIQEKDGRGKVVIEYYSREELGSILEELGLDQ